VGVPVAAASSKLRALKVCRKEKRIAARRRSRRPEKVEKAIRIWCGWTIWVACYKCRKRFELTGQSPCSSNDNLGDPTLIGKLRKPLVQLES